LDGGSIKAEGFRLDIKADGSRLDTKGKKTRRNGAKTLYRPKKELN
jgi:hypothetical protein